MNKCPEISPVFAGESKNLPANMQEWPAVWMCMEQALKEERLIYSAWDSAEIPIFTSKFPCLFSGSLVMWQCVVDS